MGPVWGRMSALRFMPDLTSSDIRMDEAVNDIQYENVLVERGDGITWVSLNRPEKRNAMSSRAPLRHGGRSRQACGGR